MEHFLTVSKKLMSLQFLKRIIFLIKRTTFQLVHFHCSLRSLLGEIKLICWSTGTTDPILSKIKKMILQNFGQLTFFLEKEKETKHNNFM